MSERKLSVIENTFREDLAEHLASAQAQLTADGPGAIWNSGTKVRDMVPFLEYAAALEQRVAEAEKLVGLTPDPEIAEAVEVVEAMMGDFGLPEHERAALNTLINRASGVTVAFLRKELAEANAMVGRCVAERDAAATDAARYRALRQATVEIVQAGDLLCVDIMRGEKLGRVSDGMDRISDSLRAAEAGPEVAQ